MKTSRRSFLIGSAAAAWLRAEKEQSIHFLKAPNGGLQPQAAVDSLGVIHLIYLYGDPAAADIGYVRKSPEDQKFSAPVRVNSQPGSAIALGTVRGAHVAIGRANRVHVAWNGSTKAEPKGPRNSVPMLYTRLHAGAEKFEPQRNVMTTGSGLDGGGSLAADSRGNVYVAWHAQGQVEGRPIVGEQHRRVWLARSADDGTTFEAENPVSAAELGACGCCGMGALADQSGNLYLLYRSARESVHRDMYLLTSRDRGKTFQSLNLHPWELNACPMSTVSLASANGRVLLAWETAMQVYFASVLASGAKGAGIPSQPIAAPGEGANRKHPTIAALRDGRTLLVWTEGTGWKRGGSLAWQAFDEAGRPFAAKGTSPGLPAWDFATVLATENSFLVVS